MIAILKRQKFNDAIPAGCRPARRSRTRPARSPRSITTRRIVYGPRPYVLVILVRGIQDQKVSAPADGVDLARGLERLVAAVR